MPKRIKTRKIIIGLVVVAIIIAVVVLNLRRPKKMEVVEIVPVKRGAVIEKLTETGTIEMVRTVEVKSTISGEVQELFVEEGDRVTQGQLLSIIEPDPNQTLQLYNKRAALDRTKLALEEQRRKVERKKTLMEGHHIAPEEMERAADRMKQMESDYRLAKLELEILETKANITGLDLQKTSKDGKKMVDKVRILAPISGVITGRGVEVGESVVSGIASTSFGTTLFQVGDPSRMIVKAEISEVDIGRMNAGQSVEIVADAYPDTTYRGKVIRIAPVGKKPQGGNIISFNTEIEVLDKEPRLKPGMSCDIDIIFDRRDSALYLPIEAVAEVFDEGVEKIKGKRGQFVVYKKMAKMPGPDSLVSGQKAVQVKPDTTHQKGGSQRRGWFASLLGGTGAAAETTFVETPVKIGLEGSTRVEILDGTREGDAVVADADVYRKQKGLEKAGSKPKAEVRF